MTTIYSHSVGIRLVPVVREDCSCVLLCSTDLTSTCHCKVINDTLIDSDTCAFLTSRAEANEHLNTQSALVRQLTQMHQMMGTIMDKMQKWQACEQTAVKSETESVDDSPARGRRSNIPELTVNSVRGEETHSSERDMRKKSPELTVTCELCQGREILRR